MLITFKNGQGSSATFAYDTNHDFLLDSIDGYNVPVDAIIHKGYLQNGSTYIHSTVQNRKLKVSFYLYENLYNKFSQASSLFNPLAGLGTLTITNNNRTRSIDCFVSEALTEASSQGKLKHYTVSLEAPYPFYAGASRSIVFDNVNYGGIKFPLMFNPAVDMDYNGLHQQITNNGDVASAITLTITNCSITNPSITCDTTGEHLGVLTTLRTVDKLTIKTGYGEKAIYLNGQNATRLLEPSSNWLSLPSGNSVWTFEADSKNPVITMNWTEYYNCF